MNEISMTNSPTYVWHGKHFPGAMRDHRAKKRIQAENRNAVTEPKRRRSAARKNGMSRWSADFPDVPVHKPVQTRRQRRRSDS